MLILIGMTDKHQQTEVLMLKFKIFVAAFMLGATIMIAGMVYAQAVPSILDGLTAKQAVINTDSKVKNLTAFTIISTDDTKDYGKLNFLLHGWSLDAGPSYDALNAIDGGAGMIGKNVNDLLSYLPVNFWLKDKLNLTVYPAGDFISKSGGKIIHHFAWGGAYVSLTVKFGTQGK